MESPRLIAGLTRLVRDVGLAEDLAQDALLAALEQWPAEGIPRNPGAWLMADLIRNRGDKSQLSPVEATMLVNREDAIIIDVREQGEYAQGHIPNARHIPAGEIDRRAKEMEKWKDHPVILCCATGARSSSAGSALKKAGFAKVYNLRGGMMEWQKAGQPVSRKRK